MRIILIRHAEREYTAGVAEENQALTAKGIKNCRKLGELIALHEPDVKAIFSSPYRRATQTAAYLLPYLPTLQIYRVDEALSINPNVATQPSIELLESYENYNCVALVGHKPELEQLITALCGEEVGLKKAHAVCIEVGSDFQNGKLLWHLSPKSAAVALSEDVDF
ncbi:histidine phosphatase family protein [Candidatus Chlorohelix sp.]|uniref:SixA phosphatase family protein n=1 Tax=Candidatus Chlorohelix sp. TaxID=3139201 RepID=UPI00303E2399